MAYSFKYSARPGTPAAEKPDVATDVADARLQALQALLTRQQRAAQDAMVGQDGDRCFMKSRAACLGRWLANPIICMPCM